jgi:hypothetical protein
MNVLKQTVWREIWLENIAVQNQGGIAIALLRGGVNKECMFTRLQAVSEGQRLRAKSKYASIRPTLNERGKPKTDIKPLV